MDDHIAIIYNYPAVAGEAFLFSPFFMFGANICDGCFGERVYHAVTGTGANDEIVSKGYDVFKVDQDYIFAFFIFKGVYYFTSKL